MSYPTGALSPAFASLIVQADTAYEKVANVMRHTRRDALRLPPSSMLCAVGSPQTQRSRLVVSQCGGHSQYGDCPGRADDLTRYSMAWTGKLSRSPYVA